MTEKRKTKRKRPQIKEGTIAYKWTYEKRPKGISIQDQIEEAFRALEQKKRPETTKEKAKAIHKECQLKITELFPSAWPVYQLADLVLDNVIQGTTVPERIWELYRKQIESAIKESAIKSGSPVGTTISLEGDHQNDHLDFANGIPEVKDIPVTPSRPERLSAAWFEIELFNVAALQQFQDEDLQERAINWLYKLEEYAIEVQKTKPGPEINTILAKIKAAIENTGKAKNENK